MTLSPSISAWDTGVPGQTWTAPVPCTCAPTHCMNWPIESTSPPCLCRNAGVQGRFKRVVFDGQHPFESAHQFIRRAQRRRPPARADADRADKAPFPHATGVAIGICALSRSGNVGAQCPRPGHDAGNAEADVIRAFVAKHLRRHPRHDGAFDGGRAVGIDQLFRQRRQKSRRGRPEPDTDDVRVHALALDYRLFVHSFGSRKDAKAQIYFFNPFTTREMPSLMTAAPKLIESPSHLSARRRLVSNCFLWTGAICSTDFNSTLTLPSTIKSARNPSVKMEVVFYDETGFAVLFGGRVFPVHGQEQLIICLQQSGANTL